MLLGACCSGRIVSFCEFFSCFCLKRKPVVLARCAVDLAVDVLNGQILGQINIILFTKLIITLNKKGDGGNENE